jgi:hypothetical protein
MYVGVPMVNRPNNAGSTRGEFNSLKFKIYVNRVRSLHMAERYREGRRVLKIQGGKNEIKAKAKRLHIEI